MKKLIVLLIVALSVIPTQAKSLRELWVSMPDSLLATLSRNLRIEVLDLVDMGVKPHVKNLLGEDCVLDTITSDFLEISTSKVSFLQMKMLPKVSGDSIVCVVKTFLGPEEESVVEFYNQQWETLDANFFFPKDVYSSNRYLREKTDTMSESTYNKICSTLEPILVCATLSLDDSSVVFQLSLPNISRDEKKQLEMHLMQRKFKWNAEKFNEY